MTGAFVAFAVVTQNRTKLQERGGRWRKPPGGAVITTFGLILLLWPAWLR